MHRKDDPGCHPSEQHRHGLMDSLLAVRQVLRLKAYKL
jgi:hypothetical protein